MPLTKRIIPCLDIDNNRVVKGKQFVGLADAGDPLFLAEHYNQQDADELVFLDITATHQKRKAVYSLMEKVSRKLFIPLTIGGGMSSQHDIRDALNAGADKVAINSAAITNPDIVEECCQLFGSQCIVLSVDAKRTGSACNVVTHGGRTATGIDAVDWCVKNTGPGKCGEILLTSIDRDGSNDGFDVSLLKAVSEACSVPLIASGGAGSLEHLYQAISIGGSDAVLAASIFHYGTHSIH